MLFRPLAAYFVQREHWTVDQLLNAGLSEEDAVKRIAIGLETL